MRSSQCVQWVPFVFSRRFCVKSDRIVAQVWVLLATAFFSGAVAAAGNPVRVAFIDPLSGPFANTGESALKHFRAAVERDEVLRVLRRDVLDGRGGTRIDVRIEIVPFDNKASAQETLVQLRAAIDQGIRFVLQGKLNSSLNI